MSKNRKYDWKSTEPIKEDGVIKYEIYRLKTTIRCQTSKKSIKEVKQDIKKTLDRLNAKSKQGYA